MSLIIFLQIFVLFYIYTFFIILFLYINNNFSVANNITSAPLVSHTGTVRIVKYRPTQLGNNVNNPNSHYAWNNTSIVASGGAGDFCTRLWDVKQEAISAKLSSSNAGSIHAISWFDNYSIFSGCEKGMVVFNDIRDINNCIWSSDLKLLLDSSKNYFDSVSIDNLSKNSVIYSMSCDINNQLLYLGCSGGYTCSIDIRTKLICGIDKPHCDDVRSLLSYSTTPQHHYLCTSSYDTTGRIFSSILPSASKSRQLELEKLYSMAEAHSDKILSTSIVNLAKHSFLSTGADGKAILWL